jgi:hypothetical protein
VNRTNPQWAEALLVDLAGLTAGWRRYDELREETRSFLASVADCALTAFSATEAAEEMYERTACWLYQCDEGIADPIIYEVGRYHGALAKTLADKFIRSRHRGEIPIDWWE